MKFNKINYHLALRLFVSLLLIYYYSSISLGSKFKMVSGTPGAVP